MRPSQGELEEVVAGEREALGRCSTSKRSGLSGSSVGTQPDPDRLRIEAGERLAHVGGYPLDQRPRRGPERHLAPSPASPTA